MKILDLFSGAGGASEGLKQAGFPPTLAVDNWKPALATHAANHDCEHLEADIGTLDPRTLGRFDFLWGSPPCPDFSVANANRDPERGMVLVRKFLEIVAEVRPRLGWTMENVPGVADYLPPNIPRIELLNSADHGVPQIRRRIFAGSFQMPRPTHAPQRQRTLDGRILEKWVSVREALGLEGILGQPVRSLRHLSEKEKAANPFGNPDIDPRRVTEPEGSVTAAGMVILPSAHRRNGNNEPKAGRSKDRPAYAADSGGFVLSHARSLKTGAGSPFYDGTGRARTIASNPHILLDRTQHRIAILNGPGWTAGPIDLDAPSPTIADQNHAPPKMYGVEEGRNIDDIDRPAPTVVIGGGPANAGGGRAPRNARRMGSGDRTKPLRLDAPSNTIKDEHHTPPDPLPGYRRLEPSECAALQGFPRDYIWIGAKTAQYKMIGNAVPPAMSRVIALATLV